METISASDANRHFSNLLREVATGKVITVLSRGKSVATIAPAHSGGLAREAAKRNCWNGCISKNPVGLATGRATSYMRPDR